MDGKVSAVIPPKYETEVMSFSRIGNIQTSFTLRGRTATDLVDQFHSIELAEKERGYDAYLPSQVYKMAAKEPTPCQPHRQEMNDE